MPTRFTFAETYSRAQVADLIGMPKERQGGNWMTGYDEWNGEYFVFCNIGVAGRSGHDYANRWDGKELAWFAKGRTRLGQREIEELVSGNFPVHVFWRAADRTPFAYAGIARAAEIYDESPVRIVWTFDDVGRLARQNRNLSPSPVFRRGPAPVGGQRTVDVRDAETTLYLMLLEGDCRALFPDLKPDESLIKVGISNSTSRRRSELNGGFPPGAAVAWTILREKAFESGAAAYAVESRCLQHLIERKQWIGGEFGRIGSDALSQLIKEFWSGKGG